MGKANKQSLLYVIGVIALLVIAYYSRAFHTQVDDPILKMLLVMTRSVIQISLVIAWCSSVRTRIINKQVRHYLIAVGILLAFWLILRTCKWEFIAQNGTHLGRYLWYSYGNTAQMPQSALYNRCQIKLWITSEFFVRKAH